MRFIVRPWAKTEDYWSVYWDITRAVKQRLDDEGIRVAVPRRDLVLQTQPAAKA
jgi:small conductance mechanosensitive channel